MYLWNWGINSNVNSIQDRRADSRGLIVRLMAKIDAALVPIFLEQEKIALLDYPNYGNVGDSALWLGERDFFKAHGIRVAYQSCIETFNADVMRRRIDGGSIVLSGGGNFGDLYERHQRFRLRVLREFPNNRIIQLPQSVYFRDEWRLDEMASAIEAHRGFHLLCRDRESLELAKRRFRCHSALCPDMAFYLGPLSCKTAPTRPQGLLKRSDKEACEPKESFESEYCFDWVRDPKSLILYLNKRVTALYTRYPSRLGFVYPLIEWTYDKVAKRRLMAGLRKLCEAEQIVTDRLHGHILCVLLNKRHAIIDNNYGKIVRFYECWTREFSRARLYCRMPDDGTPDMGKVHEDAAVKECEQQ